MAKAPPDQGTHTGAGESSVTTTETDLGELVMRVARTVRRRGAEAMAPWGLSPHHARALRVVGRHEGIRPGELAGHLRVAPRSGSMSAISAIPFSGSCHRTPRRLVSSARRPAW